MTGAAPERLFFRPRGFQLMHAANLAVASGFGVWVVYWAVSQDRLAWLLLLIPVMIISGSHQQTRVFLELTPESVVIRNSSELHRMPRSAVDGFVLERRGRIMIMVALISNGDRLDVEAAAGTAWPIRIGMREVERLIECLHGLGPCGRFTSTARGAAR